MIILTEKDYQEIEKQLSKMQKEELIELARQTLISRRKNVLRVTKARAKKKAEGGLNAK